MACIFCQIAAGQSKSLKVFEDSETIAFLDAFPVTEGHTLVMPKKHYKSLYDLSDAEAANLFNVARRIGSMLQKALRADGMNISTAPAAIDHAHLHVVPRYDYDMMGALPDLDNKREMGPQRMQEIHQRILEFASGKQPAEAEETYKVEATEAVEEPRRRTNPMDEPADEEEQLDGNA